MVTKAGPRLQSLKTTLLRQAHPQQLHIPALAWRSLQALACTPARMCKPGGGRPSGLHPQQRASHPWLSGVPVEQGGPGKHRGFWESNPLTLSLHGVIEGLAISLTSRILHSVVIHIGTSFDASSCQQVHNTPKNKREALFPIFIYFLYLACLSLSLFLTVKHITFPIHLLRMLDIAALTILPVTAS